MITAIIVTVASLVLLTAVAVIAYRRHAGSNGQKTPSKLKVNAISSVGVAAHAPKTTMGAANAAVVSQPVNQQSMRNRFLAMGAIVAAVFGALSVKLFSLQVVSNAGYAQEAKDNLLTTVSTPAPRGLIEDASGITLVGNRQVQTVLADADVAKRPDVVLRLSVLLGIPYEVVRLRILDASSGAQSQRVVASDVPLRMVAFISEHKDSFPGVTTQIRTTRTYPYGALAAHVLGYTGTASKEDLDAAGNGRTIESGDAVGKSGIEQTYDAVLAGDHGQRTLVTDASGNVQQTVSEIEPSIGSDVRLTIQAPVQQAADRALKELVTGPGTATAASIVVMDVRDGGIVALANYPTYKPETFIGGIAQEVWDAYQTEESHFPLMNRAIAGTYPAASCFKAFTGLAGLAYGFAGGRDFVCSGTWTGFGESFPQKCWEHSGHGTLDLRTGIVVSCDVVFYEIAKSFYEARNSIGNDAMQDFIREFGYDDATGIDLAGEAKGRIPTPEWKSDYFRDVPTEAQWLPGDISNMVIGQGYVLVTPIQVARAYAAVATGKLLKPHLLKEVDNSLGETVVLGQAEEAPAPDVSEADMDVMRDALRGVVLENSSIQQIFGPYEFSAAAKTGTAEVAGKEDFAWFACYAPYEDPKFALALIVEEGGSGGTVAAPVAAKVMDVALRCDEGRLTDEEKRIERYDG